MLVLHYEKGLINLYKVCAYCISDTTNSIAHLRASPSVRGSASLVHLVLNQMRRLPVDGSVLLALLREQRMLLHSRLRFWHPLLPQKWLSATGHFRGSNGCQNLNLECNSMSPYRQGTARSRGSWYWRSNYVYTSRSHRYRSLHTINPFNYRLTWAVSYASVLCNLCSPLFMQH